MRTSTVTIGFIAVLVGAIAALMARAIILSQSRPASGPGTIVVVATKPIVFGTALTRDNVSEQNWGAATAPEGSFRSIDELTKEGQRIALAQIAKNEPILKSRITAPGQRASLSALIDPGMRAVTIRVDDVRGVAGFVMPGDRVDVALTRTEGKSAFTDILLQNVKVLAIDQLANERQDHAQVAKAVTLQVTPEQGQKVILAGGAGVLSLVLRQPEGTLSAPARRVTTGDLGEGEIIRSGEEGEDSSPRPDQAAVPSPAVSRVQIIRGVNKQEVDVYREKN